MNYFRWRLFVLRARIEMRLLLLETTARLRTGIAAVIAGIGDVPRLSLPVRRGESHDRRLS